MEEEMPDLVDSPVDLGERADDSDGDPDEWEECEDADMSNITCHCLFCPDTFPASQSCITHIDDRHNVNIPDICRRRHMDCFDYIKMINYIRETKCSATEIQKLIFGGSGLPPWDSDNFMKPAIADDPLLQIDPEDFTVVDPDKSCDNTSPNQSELSGSNHLQNNVSSSEHHLLMQRVKAAEMRAVTAEDRLQEALADLEKMRIVARDLVLSHNVEMPSSDKAIENLRSDEDEAYFGSYSHFSIHQDMLQDKVRTESYQSAICNNPKAFKDKVVLDVGCGTGILSMFAAKAGAKKVIGIEMSDIIYQAMDIIRENCLEHKVSLIKGRMEDVNLPVDQVDIIISEWMGYNLLFESMLDTVLWARDRYLKDDGFLMPDKCCLYLAALDDQDMLKTHYDYWDNVYGFKMTCMRKCVMAEPSVVIVKNDKLISEGVAIKTLDLSTCTRKDLEFCSSFTITATRDGCIMAIVSYFDIDFASCTNKVYFSTGPSHTATHWKQTVFLLEHGIHVAKDDTIEGAFSCRKNPRDPRSLLITLTIGDKATTYRME